MKDYVGKDSIPYGNMELEDIALDHHYPIRSLKEGEARQIIQDLKSITNDFRNTESNPRANPSAKDGPAWSVQMMAASKSRDPLKRDLHY